MKAKILLVDDDHGHRKMLTTVLEDWEYHITEAKDGEEAVEACLKRPYDLVLMDIRMPKKTGLEALIEIKHFNPAIPILIMTAFSAIDTAIAAIKEGAYDYLTKPLDFEKLKNTLHNIFSYTELIKENTALSASLHENIAMKSIIGSSEPVKKVLDMITAIAPSEVTVLITGESGTGKELFAKAVLQGSKRYNGPYVTVNCAAITETLLESELFGHEKGAFTGAEKAHDGRFVHAHNGTIFLDEIGEMPLSMQVKILRVIQEREVTRVGGNTTIPVDVRIIAATNRDLLEEVSKGTFREDLYYRLNVVNIKLPALRERADDVPLLAQHFLQIFATKNNKTIRSFTPAAMDCLIRYPWPGNVRELENVIERSVVLVLGDQITEKELPEHLQLCPALVPQNTHVHTKNATSLEDIERIAILQALERAGGNKTEAAKQLGITRKTLHAKLHKYENES